MIYEKPSAELVYDGLFMLPAASGQPRADQLVGTDLEKLCELAGRECYDSLGRGRSSADYHEHIRQVNHLSVYEHANLTIVVTRIHIESAMMTLLNRPGFWVRRMNRDTLRVTFNLRAALEWDLWPTCEWDYDHPAADLLRDMILTAARDAAPQIVPAFDRRSDLPLPAVLRSSAQTNDERWISMRLSGSRGLSHEQVRHGDFTAISQRSTRYVDESESAWVMHPLVEQSLSADPEFEGGLARFVDDSRRIYKTVAGTLESSLTADGVDKVTARKQARGAARGFLGNALGTSMIFSASISQWRRMLRQRLHPAADAEIRQLYVSVLDELKESTFCDQFHDMVLTQSPDGIGEVLWTPQSES